METVQIRAGDLLLRPWQPEDATAVHRACQDPEPRRWVTGLPWPYERGLGRSSDPAGGSRGG